MNKRARDEEAYFAKLKIINMVVKAKTGLAAKEPYYAQARKAMSKKMIEDHSRAVTALVK
jgi:hypothetical protein